MLQQKMEDTTRTEEEDLVQALLLLGPKVTLGLFVQSTSLSLHTHTAMTAPLFQYIPYLSSLSVYLSSLLSLLTRDVFLSLSAHTVALCLRLRRPPSPSSPGTHSRQSRAEPTLTLCVCVCRNGLSLFFLRPFWAHSLYGPNCGLLHTEREEGRKASCCSPRTGKG